MIPGVSDETYILGPRLKRWELLALCSWVAGYPAGGRQQGPVSQPPQLMHRFSSEGGVALWTSSGPDRVQAGLRQSAGQVLAGK